MNTEILNKYIELIDKGYCDDCNELNCLGNFPHKDIAKNIKAILEENQELKKQLEEQDYTSVYLKGCIDTKGKYLSQQKEFIEWLNNKIIIYQREEENYGKNTDRAFWIAFESALSKYEKIIGSK